MQQSNHTELIPKKYQRRSWFAALTAWILICPGILLVGFCFAVLFNPTAIFYLIITAGPAIALGWLSISQYCAMYCCRPILSRAYHEGFFLIGGFLIFAVVANIGEAVTEKVKFTRDIIHLFAGMSVAGVLFIFLGIVNRSIYLSRRKYALETQLAKKEDFIVLPFSDSKYRTRTILGFFGMFLAVCLTAGFLIYDSNRYPPSGENLSYEEMPFKSSFPTTISDFSYRKGFRGTIYCEFTITEENFRKWIASEDRWEYCRPIGNPDDWFLKNGLRKPLTDEQLENLKSPTDGLYAGYGKGKGGRAVFDRETNRAYYWTYY